MTDIIESTMDRSGAGGAQGRAAASTPAALVRGGSYRDEPDSVQRLGRKAVLGYLHGVALPLLQSLLHMGALPLETTAAVLHQHMPTIIKLATGSIPPTPGSCWSGFPFFGALASPRFYWHVQRIPAAPAASCKTRRQGVCSAVSDRVGARAFTVCGH